MLKEMKMAKYVVIGAGTIGSLVAEELAQLGHQITLGSRHGNGPQQFEIEKVRVDATDEASILRLVKGANAVINCANPPYHRWITDWPPIANSLLHAAKSSGASLVTLGNLYPYGLVDGPITPQHPLNATYAKAQVRSQMWSDALNAHEAGYLRATELRASDYIGPNAHSLFGTRTVKRLVQGKTCWFIGNVDLPHSWTYVGDVAKAIAVAVQSESAWGRAWHVPTNPPRTMRQVANDLADAGGLPRTKIATLPRSIIYGAGIFSPLIRELPKTLYQFTHTFVIDDSETRRTFNLEPTQWSVVLNATLVSIDKALSKNVRESGDSSRHRNNYH